MCMKRVRAHLRPGPLASLRRSTLVRTTNQLLSLTDQMNMGVRQIELDIHWHNGQIRLCHAGGVHIQKLNELVQVCGGGRGACAVASAT